MNPSGNLFRRGINWGNMPAQIPEAQPDYDIIQSSAAAAPTSSEVVPATEPQMLIRGVDYRYNNGRLEWANYVPADIRATSELPLLEDTVQTTTGSNDFIDGHIRLENDNFSFEGVVRTSLSSLATRFGSLAATGAARATNEVEGSSTHYAEVVQGSLESPSTRRERKNQSQPLTPAAGEQGATLHPEGTSALEYWKNRKRMDPKLFRWLVANFVAFPLFLDSCLALGMATVTHLTPYEDHAHGVIVNFGHFPGVDTPSTAYGRIKHPSKLFGP
jgi:hypothetical protein